MLKKVCAVVAAAAVTLGAVSVPCSAAATLEATWQLYGATGFEEYSAFKADGMEGFAAGDMTIGNPTGANGKVLNSLTVADDSAMGGNALVAELNPEINKINSGYGTLNGTWQKQGAILIGGKAGAADGNGISKYAYLFDTVGTSYRVSCDAVAYGLETGTKALVKMRSMSNMNDRCMVGGAQDYIDYNGQEINTVKNREDIKKTDFKRVSWEFTAKQVKDGAVILIEFPETDVSKEQAYIMLDNLVVERKLSNLSVEKYNWNDGTVFGDKKTDLFRIAGVNAKQCWFTTNCGNICFAEINSPTYTEGGAVITSNLLSFTGSDIGTEVNIDFNALAYCCGDGERELPLSVKIKDKNDNVLLTHTDSCPGYTAAASSALNHNQMKNIKYSFAVDEQTVDAAKIEITVSGITEQNSVYMALDDMKISVAPPEANLTTGIVTKEDFAKKFGVANINLTQGWAYGQVKFGIAYACEADKTKTVGNESGIEIKNSTFLNMTEENYGKKLRLDFGIAAWNLKAEENVNLEVRAKDADGNNIDTHTYAINGKAISGINNVPADALSRFSYEVDINEDTSKIKSVSIIVKDIDKTDTVGNSLWFGFADLRFTLSAPNASIKNVDNGCMIYERTQSGNAYMTGAYRADGTLEGAAYDTANRYLLLFSDSTALVKAFLFEDLTGIKPLAKPIYNSR